MWAKADRQPAVTDQPDYLYDQAAVFTTLDEFRGLATEGNLIPLYREILWTEEPVSAFAKIDHQGPTAYLLERWASGENWARYSFWEAALQRSSIHEKRGDLILTRGKTPEDSEPQQPAGSA